MNKEKERKTVKPIARRLARLRNKRRGIPSEKVIAERLATGGFVAIDIKGEVIFYIYLDKVEYAELNGSEKYPMHRLAEDVVRLILVVCALTPAAEHAEYPATDEDGNEIVGAHNLVMGPQLREVFARVLSVRARMRAAQN